MSFVSRALSLSFAVAAATCASAQTAFELLATPAPASAESWTQGPAFAATDMEPLAFAVRSTSTATGARVALFVRAVAPPETIELLDQAFPGHGIDLTAFSGPFAPTAPNANFVLEGPALEATPSHVQGFLTEAAATPTASTSSWSVPWSGATFPAEVGGQGVAWPAVAPEWQPYGYDMLVWTPSYVGRHATSVVPGGMLTTFSPSRLLERSILMQSADPAIARAFMSSVVYGTAFLNEFTLHVQAIISVPSSGSTTPPTLPVFKTNVFRVYVHLTPGEDEEKDSAFYTSRAGLIFDGGFESAVILALGQLGVPTGAWFHGPEGLVEGLGFAPLAPTDPYCPYYVVWRPPGCGGAVASITLEEVQIGNVFFSALPPTGDPLITLPMWPTLL